MTQILVEPMYHDAQLPTRGSAGAIGWDVYAYLKDVDTNSMLRDQNITPVNNLEGVPYITLMQGANPVLIPLGFRIAVPEGWDCHLRSRSGLSLKGVEVSCGTIDPDYRGPMGIIMWCDSAPLHDVTHGDRLGQLVFTETPKVELKEVQQLPTTERGDDGFGSTGR